MCSWSVSKCVGCVTVLLLQMYSADPSPTTRDFISWRVPPGWSYPGTEPMQCCHHYRLVVGDAKFQTSMLPVTSCGRW